MTWKRTRIGDLCDLVNGRAFKPSDWTGLGLPIVRIQNLNNPTKPFNYFDGIVKDKHVINTGDVLLSWSGTPGTSFGCFRWTRGKAVLNQHIFKVIVDRNIILPMFFLHAVNSQLGEMIDLAHGGVGLRHITKGKLQSIEIPTPGLDEQRRVVAWIREAMERVDELRRLREEARHEASALFSSVLDQAENDAGDRDRTVDEVLLESRNGRSIQASGQNGNGRVLTLASVRGTVLDTAMFKSVDLDDTTAQKYQVERNDVFISRANTMEFVGLSAMARVDVERRTIYPDLMIRLRAEAAIIEPRYLMYALRFPQSRRQIRERATGSSQSMVKISGERLRTVKLPIPSLQEQRRIADRLDEAWRVTSQISSEYDSDPTLSMRAAILHKAFAGEL